MKTMVEIAKDLGVSQATVSLCLSGKAAEYRVKLETVRRVQDYAAQVGFVPNTAARNLVMRKQAENKVALLLVQEGGSEKSLHALSIAKKILDQAGREYLLQDCFPETFISTVRSLKGEGIKEVILFGPFYHEESWVKGCSFDADAYRSFFQNINLYTLDDNFIGHSPFADYLYRLGVDRNQMYFDLFGDVERRTGGQMAYCFSVPLTLQEFTGFCAARDLSIHPERCLLLDRNIENVFDKGKALIDPVRALMERLPIKFIFVPDDRVATGLINGLLGVGVKVPDDVSIIGFDNIDTCPHFKVALTSVSIPIEEHVRIVMSKILDGKKIPRVTKSEAKIIWRDSAKRF